jgi:hypothetical protein
MNADFYHFTFIMNLILKLKIYFDCTLRLRRDEGGRLQM